jgi:DNA-binding Lrp family transcriptional regulator
MVTARKKFKIDEIDRKIITLIQNDPNITHSDIAQKVDRSQPTIGMRLKKLTNSGVLKIQAGLNFKKVDIFLALVSLKTATPEKIMHMSSHCPFIMNAYKLSGEYNIILSLASAKLDKLDGLVNSHFRNKDEIQAVKMEVVIDIAKDLILPINFSLQDELDPSINGECTYCLKFPK